MFLQLEHTHPALPQSHVPSPRASKEHKHADNQPSKPQAQPQDTHGLVMTLIRPKHSRVDEEQHPAPKYKWNLDGLDGLLQAARSEMPVYVWQCMQSKMKCCEDRVYNFSLAEKGQFISLLQQGLPQAVQHEIALMMDGIHNSVEADIWDGQFKIDTWRSKAGGRLDQSVLLAQELLKRNIDSLKYDLSLDPKGNQPARRAAEFVRKLQDEQELHRQRIKSKQEQQAVEQARSQQQRAEFQQQLKQEKRQQLRRKLQKQQQQKQQEKQRRQQINSAYLSMVSNYQKPLYQQKEEQFHAYLKQQNKLRMEKIREVLEDKRSISHDEIKEHMARYKEIKEDKEFEREEAAELKQQEFELRKLMYYKSKKFASLDATARLPDPIQAKTALVNKKNQYAHHIKQNFMPKANPTKQRQLQQVIKNLHTPRQLSQSVQQSRHLVEGNKNLQKIHRLVEDLRARNKLKPNVSYEQFASPAPRPVYPDYMREVKSQRKTAAIDYDARLLNDDFQLVRIEALKREDRAEKQQKYLKHAIATTDIHEHMRGQGQLEEDYLMSARAKIAIIKNLQGQ